MEINVVKEEIIKDESGNGNDVKLADAVPVEGLPDAENQPAPELVPALSMVTPPAPPPLSFDSMMMVALQRPDGDKALALMERLIAMKNAEEDRRAKQDFELHFAKMQAEFGTVVKENKAMKGNEVMYAYADLATLRKAFGPTISNNGFSYSWREEALPTGGKREVLMISGYNYTKETFFDIPPLDKVTERMNAIQAMGAMSTYGRRYTFMAGFGITPEGEDDDGMSAEERKGIRLLDTRFTKIAGFAKKEKQASYANTWDSTDTDDRPTVLASMREEIFEDMISILPPERIRVLHGLWKECKKPSDYIALMEEARK